MTDRESSAAIVDSLAHGDHIGLDRQRLRGALGMTALVLGCLTTQGEVRRSRMLFVVANPVAHGARLASAVMRALPSDATIVTDHRLADPSVAAGEHFPSLAARSLIRVVTPARLREALRLRRARSALPRAGSRLYAEYLFLAQAVRFAAARDLLTEGGAEAVVADFDRAPYSSPLVHAAKELGVVTVTLVHGMPNRANYLPVLADHVLAWGEVQRSWFHEHGVDAAIHLVGRPDVPDEPSRGAGAPRLIVSQSAEDLSDAELTRILDRVRTAADGGLATVLRLHPSVSADALDQRWRRVAEAVELTIVGRGALSDDIGAGDVVAVIESSSAMDAIAGGARVEVLADAERVLPADLEALVRARDSGQEVPRSALLVAGGQKAIERIAAVLRGLLPHG